MNTDNLICVIWNEEYAECIRALLRLGLAIPELLPDLALLVLIKIERQHGLRNNNENN